MTKLIARSAAAAAILLPLVGCPAVAPGTTAPPSNITGSVVKGTAPFPNATVRLIQKANNASSDFKVITTDAAGTFKFENVPPGTYRVAYDRATPDQRSKNETVYHAAATDTYGFFSTDEFTFSGGASQTHQVPQLDVAWAANLQPAPDGTAKAPVTFSWNAAPGASSYTVRIANEANNTLFTSSALSGSTTTFTWDGKTSTGSTAAPGKYLWSVNVNTAKGNGGTNVSRFTLQ